MFIPEKNIFSIIGSAFSVYGKNAKYLAVITIMAFVPVFVFRLFIPQYYQDAVTAFMNIIMETSEIWVEHFVAYGYFPDIVPVVSTQLQTGFVMYYLIFFGIELVFFPLSTAAAVYLVARHLSNEEPSFGGMFSASLPIFPKMIITSVLAFGLLSLMFTFSAGVLGGLLLLLTLYISVGMVFYQHIVADVGRWGLSAISLSRFIIRGRWFRVLFGSIVLFSSYFIISFMMVFFGAIFGIQSNPFIHLPFFLIQHFVLSFFAIAFALWYFDIKRFQSISFQQIGNEIIRRMQDSMDGFGRDRNEDEDDEEDKDK